MLPFFVVQIHYEGGGSRTPATDIICPMYARVHQTITLGDLPGESFSTGLPNACKKPATNGC